jgi:hypothetical protein
MRHLSTLLSLVALALVGAVVLGRGGLAQDASPAAMDQHSLVGTWLADSDGDNAADPPALIIAAVDGGWIEVAAGGEVALGRWERTGATTATLTRWSLGRGEEGDSQLAGTVITRARIEVTAGGYRLTASYTIAVIAPDGTLTGESGPGTARAIRLSAEPMGEPVGPFEDLFAQFEEATPEASPAP